MILAVTKHPEDLSVKAFSIHPNQDKFYKTLDDNYKRWEIDAVILSY